MKTASLIRLGARIRLWQLALAVMFVVGCQSINHLRDAQNAFNQAATEDLRASIENDLSVDETIDSGRIGKWVAVRNLYGSALISLHRINSNDERLLREENLWGAKLALEALCQWKLGAYDKAMAIAREAQKTEQLFPRDRMLMAALPGLIMTDHAYSLLLTKRADSTNLLKKVANLTVNNDGAIVVIARARAGENVDPNLEVFLLQAQLAAYRNYRKAYERTAQTGVPTNAPPHLIAQKQLDELAGLVRGPSGKKLVEDWAQRNHLQAPSVQ